MARCLGCAGSSKRVFSIHPWKSGTAWACRRGAPPGFRPRTVPPLPSRPFGFNPSRTFAPVALRASLASRGSAQGPSPPRAAWRPCESAEPACAGSARSAPRRQWGGRSRYALACCGRLREYVPSSTLPVRLRNVTRDGSRTRSPASPWSFHTTPQAFRHRMRQGRLRSPLG